MHMNSITYSTAACPTIKTLLMWKHRPADDYSYWSARVLALLSSLYDKLILIHTQAVHEKSSAQGIVH